MQQTVQRHAIPKSSRQVKRSSLDSQLSATAGIGLPPASRFTKGSNIEWMMVYLFFPFTDRAREETPPALAAIVHALHS